LLEDRIFWGFIDEVFKKELTTLYLNLVI